MAEPIDKVEVRCNYMLIGYCSRADSARCYAGYHAEYPGQSHERVIERGGWGKGELDQWAPGWTLLPLAPGEVSRV